VKGPSGLSVDLWTAQVAFPEGLRGRNTYQGIFVKGPSGLSAGAPRAEPLSRYIYEGPKWPFRRGSAGGNSYLGIFVKGPSSLSAGASSTEFLSGYICEGPKWPFRRGSAGGTLIRVYL